MHQSGDETPDTLLPLRWLRALRSSLRRLLLSLWNDPVSRLRAWIVVAGLFVCLYSLSVVGYVLALPDLGVHCAFTPIVNRFDHDFLFPDNQPSFPREGDRILQVADQPVDTWSQFLRKILLLRHEQPAVVPGLTAADLRAGKVPSRYTDLVVDGQRVVRLVYERESASGPVRASAWCRVGRIPVDTLVPSVLWFFFKIALFLVVAVVFWKRPEDLSVGLFFLLCVVTICAFMGGYHWSRIVTQPLLIAVFMGCALFLPAVTLHFYLVFPRPKTFFAQRRWRLLGVIYGVPLLFLLLLLQGYLRVRWLDLGGGMGLWSSIEGALRHPPDDPSSGVRLLLLEILYEIYVYFGLAAIWYLCAIASLLHSYWTAANAIERNQVKYILMGCAASLVPIGYTMYLAFWEQGRFGGGGATWPMFAASACITLAYTFSITRYRLLELDQMISSGAVYFLVSFLAGMVYYGVVFAGLLLVGSRAGEGPSLGQVIGVCGAALVLMVALDVIRGRLMRAVEKHLRREKYQLDTTLQRMSQAIEKLVDPPTLARQLLDTTTDLLSVPRGAIYLRGGEPALYQLTEARGVPPPLNQLSPGCPLIEALRAQGPTVGLDPTGTNPASRQLSFLGGVVSQALIHEGQLLGLLVLGARTGGAYTSEDLQILSAFARTTVLALVSAEGHRTIEGLNRELKTKVEKIAEQQRRIMALQTQLMKREDRRNALEEPIATNGHAKPAEQVVEAAITGISGPRPATCGLVGSSVQVQQLMHLVKRVAASSSAVLLRGESGTGKELLARALHENSPRASKPFVKVHCAALSPGLLESELFGHVKGAFTSAIRDKVGRFESADGGSLFLDEIGDITLEVQTKLLRVLEEMTFERVGSSEPVQVDVRIIAATHRDLEGMIREGKFREDLYFRLNVLPIQVPPLRDRAEDVIELAHHFLDVYALKLNKSVRTLDDDALLALKAYTWPGNVRQLENVIERAVVIAEGTTVGTGELPEEILDLPTGYDENGTNENHDGDGMTVLTLPELASVFLAERADRDRREREQLLRALAAAGGNKAEAARALGLARSTLISRLKKLGLS